MESLPLERLCSGYRRACERRSYWEPLWRDCLKYGQPMRKPGAGYPTQPGQAKSTDLFDGTAADGVEQLAASLLAELTPPWSKWFAVVPGADVEDEIKDEISSDFQQMTRRIQAHFDRSNFAVEMHQCLLDAVTIGTATLLFEEAPAGSSSAFHFTAVPATEMAIEGNRNGRIVAQYRTTTSGLANLANRFPKACDWQAMASKLDDPEMQPLELCEAVIDQGQSSTYTAFLPESLIDHRPVILSNGQFESPPFITFRWMKGAGEVYGRSPLMNALPDIKTANKVVELILKNASIAVTGIWLAEDDGVLNPANIHLVPGSIIPKAAGSSGLTPLQSPGRLDVSELVLEDLRNRIRHTLMTDRLSAIGQRSMTATEILERSAEVSRLLGAIYGRLQSELLTPLLKRAIAILSRRGEIAHVRLDGSIADLQYLSPLARTQSREEVRNVVMWLDTLGKLERSDAAIIDRDTTARWLAESLGVPAQLMHSRAAVNELLAEMEDEA